MSLTGEDYIELLPTDWRAITDAGIQIDYRTYNSRELRLYARKSSGVASRGGRWEVHFDPYDVSRIWVRNHHHGGWITVAWTHQSVVGQPFADFTWRASRRIAAQRGVDNTNEMAVAVILAALLRRAEQGPGVERVLARHTAAREVTNHLPVDVTDLAVEPVTQPRALPAPPIRVALPPALEEGGQDEACGSQADEVVPFGIFDPFADDLEASR